MSQEVFHAVSEPNRRRLLELVGREERCAGELVGELGLTPGAISQHLKILADAGLVTRRKEGRFRYYRASPRRLREIRVWIERFEEFWENRLARLERVLDGNS